MKEAKAPVFGASCYKEGPLTILSVVKGLITYNLGSLQPNLGELYLLLGGPVLVGWV